MDFIETGTGKQMFADIVRAAKEYDEANLTDDEKAVKEQRTLIYKFWCGMIYGHLMKNGVCLRCGYKPNKK